MGRNLNLKTASAKDYKFLAFVGFGLCISKHCSPARIKNETSMVTLATKEHV